MLRSQMPSVRNWLRPTTADQPPIGEGHTGNPLWHRRDILERYVVLPGFSIVIYLDYSVSMLDPALVAVPVMGHFHHSAPAARRPR